MVTIKDISDKCGVSKATVSKALNGHTDIGAATIEKIKKVADELGYFPNASARALKTNRTYNLGVLFVDKTHSGLQHEYFSAILNSVKVGAEKLGYDITFSSSNMGKLKMSYYEHAKYRRFDGVIIASVDFYDPDVVRLVESEIPTVTIDHIFNTRTAIVSDNVKGMEELLEYAYGRGHRKIAYIHGEDTAVTRNRLASFYKTAMRLGLEVPPEYVREGVYHDPKPSGQQTRALLNLPNPPTCILYPDDYSFLGGETEIEEHNLKIPDDISVAGYDGIYLSRVLRPRLTTYKQDTASIGELAAQKLISMIENPKLFIAEQIYVHGELQRGGTIKHIDSK